MDGVRLQVSDGDGQPVAALDAETLSGLLLKVLERLRQYHVREQQVARRAKLFGRRFQHTSSQGD